MEKGLLTRLQVLLKRLAMTDEDPAVDFAGDTHPHPPQWLSMSWHFLTDGHALLHHTTLSSISCPQLYFFQKKLLNLISFLQQLEKYKKNDASRINTFYSHFRTKMPLES